LYGKPDRNGDLCVSDVLVHRVQTIPIVAHIPHSGTHIPGWVRSTLLLSDEELDLELRKMTDWYTDQLFHCVVQMGEAAVVCRYSRLVVDVERFENDEDEMMASRGMGVIYTRTSSGRPLRSEPLPAEERETLLEKFYRPHHRKMEEVVLASLDKFSTCLVLDCHSFPSRPLPYELDQDPARPDICLGTDDYHTPVPLLRAAREVFRQQEFRVATNSPFAGTYVPMKFLKRDRRVKSLMIEVNRRLYMNEGECRKSSDFGRIQVAIETAVRRLVQDMDQCR